MERLMEFRNRWGQLLVILMAVLLMTACSGSSQDVPAGTELIETQPSETQPETQMQKPEIQVSENREGEPVFSLSIDDFIGAYNGCWEAEYGRSYLTPSSQWQCQTIDSAIHSDYETLRYYFTENEQIYSLPTIMTYVPSNGDGILEIAVNYDEHSYTEWGFEQYREMCFCTLKVFFPELSDEAVLELCTDIISLGKENVFTSDEWYAPGAVPCALYHRNGVGVYPYFAVGDWERLCVIPVTEETIRDFAEKGVEIHEID